MTTDGTTIWKFTFAIDDDIEIEMPVAAKVLTVQMQGDTPTIWAIVNSKAPKETRRFRLAGTGHSFNESDAVYVGTFQMADGALVFHLFERTAKGGA